MSFDKPSIQAFRRGNVSIGKQIDDYVSLGPALPWCKGKDTELIDALYSLTQIGQQPYPAPYIVVLVEREKVLSLKKGSPPLVAQVYVGRLLFELIAYEDTKILFSALIPDRPVLPVAKMPVFDAPLLQRSPSPANETPFTLSSLLRRAESLTYHPLTPTQRRKVEACLSVKLYPFQRQTVRWMIDRENDINSINEYFWEERSFTSSYGNDRVDRFYYFPRAGELRLSKPPDIRGGMVTEEMGLGKTVEALALIAAQKQSYFVSNLAIRLEKKPMGVSVMNGFVNVKKLSQRNEDIEKQTDCPLHFGDEILNPNNRSFPKTVKVRRSAPRSTLVVCPKSLIAQWKHEAVRQAPSLTVIEWEIPSRDSDGTHWSAAVGEHAHDVVLATYEALQKDPCLSKICWKRLILDEAQVTRRSSSQVAKDTFNLRSESRFLMTGTPIVTTIDDIRGELAFLRVWPFTLLNDGFWEKKIQLPFVMKNSTVLIDHLLSVTMVRHTKAQNLDLGLPPRSYETIEVELTGSHRAVYCFILGVCLEELELWAPERRFPRQLRQLLKILLCACISPSLINLRALDLARRSIWSRRTVFNRRSFSRNRFSGALPSFMKVTPTEAITFLAEIGGRIARDSNRTLATLHGTCVNQFEQFLVMDREALLNIVETRGALPQNPDRTTKRRLAQLAAGGLHRIAGDNTSELRETIISLGLLSGPEADLISRRRAVQLLRAHYQKNGTSEPGRPIHEAGFAALTRLIEKKESPSCPVCLCGAMERISLTKCGHFYCVECLMLMFSSCSTGVRAVKCAICRKDVRHGMVVEVVVVNEEEEIAIKEENKPVGGVELEEPTKQLMTFVYRSDVNRYRNAPRPTAVEVWDEYQEIGRRRSRFSSRGRNPDLPSLDGDFLQHLQAATMEGAVAPKLFALRSLINSCSDDTKFCVVAETEGCLKGICKWLNEQGIASTGVGSPEWSGSSKAIGLLAKEFTLDAAKRVFLLNTANSAGLTLTAAQYVVLMEPMLRITDEMQAAARVHRIGQTRPVKVIRILSKGTVEEQIMFRRGEISTPGEETQALMPGEVRETPAFDLFTMFRDGSEW